MPFEKCGAFSLYMASHSVFGLRIVPGLREAADEFPLMEVAGVADRDRRMRHTAFR